MKSNYLLGLMTIVALTGCNKSLELTAAGQEAVTKSKNENLSKMHRQDMLRDAQTLQARGQVKTSLTKTNGELDLFSDLDLNDLNGQLLFNDLAPTFRDISRAAYSVQMTAKTSDGFVKQSNLIFRAIQKLPLSKPESIKSIDSITLTLTGVRVSAPSGSASVTLANQILCMFQSKSCSGVLPTDSTSGFNTAAGYTAANANFSSFAKESDFVSSHTIAESGTDASGVVTGVTDSKLFSYVSADGTGTITLPIMQIFGLSTQKDAIQWLKDNSVAYDKSGNFRKFRFILGNNIYADSGKLDIQMTTDTSALPADYVSAQPVAAVESDATRVLYMKDTQPAKDRKDVVYNVAEGILKDIPNTAAGDDSGDTDPVSADAYGSKGDSTMTSGLSAQDKAAKKAAKKARKAAEKLAAPVTAVPALNTVIDPTSDSAVKIKSLAGILDANAANISLVYVYSHYDLSTAQDVVANTAAKAKAKALANAITTAMATDLIPGLKGRVQPLIATTKTSHCGSTLDCADDRQIEIAIILSDTLSQTDKDSITKDITAKLDGIFKITTASK